MTFVVVTDSQQTTDNSQPGEETPGETQARTRVGTRARDRMVAAVRAAVTQRAQARRVAGPVESGGWQPRGLPEDLGGKSDRRTDAEKAAPDVRGANLWIDGPASPAEQWAYLRAGAWAPGEQHGVVEAVAKAYGLLVWAVTVAVVVPLWVLQRPGRTALALVVGLLWWAAAGLDAPPPVDPAAVQGGAP